MDELLGGAEDVVYGGDGNDYLDGRDEGPKDTQRDELYCGAGRDKAIAGKYNSVSSSCEEKVNPPKGGGWVRVD
jgi:Ca2+-binding RTX toxin-like protein